MSEGLRTAIHAADGAGRLEGEEVGTGRAEHPACGDELELDLRVVDGVVADLAWRAAGCPATIAVAASSRAALRGAPVTEARQRLAAHLSALGGLGAHERHAERMLLTAFDAAVESGR